MMILWVYYFNPKCFSVNSKNPGIPVLNLNNLRFPGKGWVKPYSFEKDDVDERYF